ncbi:MAG: exosortase-associated EpsI family protein [Armatimonadetes bacterium]|nr:exosortase-associated EpsI family protein [Armatimonadota bacterium]
MEGLIKRAYVLAGIFVLSGALVMATKPKNNYERKSEEDLIALAPTQVGSMHFVKDPSGKDERITYKMDPTTYQVLQPFGIVARVFTDGTNTYDAVVIASQSRASFHDPQVCFSAQRWVITAYSPITVHTKTRGDVPVMRVLMSNETDKNRLAAFCYRGPSGKFYASTQGLKIGMFLDQFMGKDKIYGVFYRFMVNSPNTTEDEFKKFIGDYLDAAKASSNDYF